jgi:hypothetical protein
MKMRRRRHERSVNAISSENVKHLISASEQIVRDDSAMTSPPNRLCAHDALRLAWPNSRNWVNPALKSSLIALSA